MLRPDFLAEMHKFAKTCAGRGLIVAGLPQELNRFVTFWARRTLFVLTKAAG
jgi:hypothetical protein